MTKRKLRTRIEATAGRCSDLETRVFDLECLVAELRSRSIPEHLSSLVASVREHESDPDAGLIVNPGQVNAACREALRAELDSALLARDDLIFAIELAVRRLGEDGGGETTIANARAVLRNALSRFAPKPGAETKAWADRQRMRYARPATSGGLGSEDDGDAVCPEIVAEREHLRRRIEEAHDLLSRYGGDSEGIHDARLLLRDALEPGVWAELDHALKRVRLQNGSETT